MTVEEKTFKVLVVDDEEDVRSLMHLMLTKRKFLVEQAAGGREALEKVAQNKPDIILLDIRMPGMDGFQVHRHLRASPETQDIPVIFCTALRIPYVIEKAKSAYDDFIHKPFEFSALHEKIKAVLQRRQNS